MEKLHEDELKNYGLKKCRNWCCKTVFNTLIEKKHACLKYRDDYCNCCLLDMFCYDCDICNNRREINCNKCHRSFHRDNYDIYSYCMKDSNTCHNCKLISNEWCGKCDSCIELISISEIEKCVLCGKYKSNDLCTKCEKCDNVYCTTECYNKLCNNVIDLKNIKKRFEHIGINLEFNVCDCLNKEMT